MKMLPLLILPQKRPRDANQLAKRIVDLSTDEAEEERTEETGKDPAAVALGRKGGLKGGKARAKALSAERRSEISRAAAKARWGKRDKQVLEDLKKWGLS